MNLKEKYAYITYSINLQRDDLDLMWYNYRKLEIFIMLFLITMLMRKIFVPTWSKLLDQLTLQAITEGLTF